MSLSTKKRIKRPEEFHYVFEFGRRYSSRFVNVIVSRNEFGYSRLGLAVGKRVGNAVTRNLVKRRLRNVFSLMDTISGWDVVIVAKYGCSDASFTKLTLVIRKLLLRAGVSMHSPRSYVNGSL